MSEEITPLDSSSSPTSSNSPVADVDDAKKQIKVNLFKNLPVFHKCQHCGHSGHTIVDQRTTYISFVLMITSFFLFGIFFSFFLIPLIVLLTRNFYHRCSVCLAEVGCDNKIIGMTNLEDKMITLKIGEFGLIVTRKIVLGILLTFIMIFTIYSQISSATYHHHAPIININDTWEEFIQRCGRESLHTRGFPMAIECDKYYVEKTINNWKGYIIRVEDYRDSFYRYMHHAIGILVRMQPPESEYFPDLILALDTDKADEYGDMIENLNRGSEIIFNATIMTVGNELKTRHLHVVDIKKGEGYLDVPAHLHDHGRYADKPRIFRGALPTNQGQ